ncbi:MAG: TatD DNase family protein [Bacillota bacterium]|nr:TatD DNase family protein [Bacillota bacterium]MDK2856653.1 TatD DNase family protein [Bacillota bacterium]MDK2925668.1 TatD DNase family protein [Bacillota bacterium]
MLIDTHAHLQEPDLLSDLEDVLRRAQAAGIEGIICVGYDLPSSRLAVKLAEEHPLIWAAVGLHPENLDSLAPDTYDRLAELAQRPRVVAWGEIGLDYVHGDPDRARQKEAFRRQLEIARTLNLPVIIHDREAHADTLAILEEAGPRQQAGVMHCFSGSAELARECLALGYYISFAGPVTFKNARRVREVAATIPAERLLCETDSPYLSPEPYRGQRNEPARVLEVATQLAALFKETLPTFAPRLTANARRLFGLEAFPGDSLGRAGHTIP